MILQRYGHFITTSNQQDGLFSCGGGFLGYDFLVFLLSLPLENANCDKVKGFNNFIFRYLKIATTSAIWWQTESGFPSAGSIESLLYRQQSSYDKENIDTT